MVQAIKKYRYNNIWWRWQVDYKNEWMGVAYSTSEHKYAAWMWDPIYGNGGHTIWNKRKRPGRLVVLNHCSLYTDMSRFARLCKEKIKDKLFFKKYKLNKHIEKNLPDMYKVFAYRYITNKFGLCDDIIIYISTYLPLTHLCISDYYRF